MCHFQNDVVLVESDLRDFGTNWERREFVRRSPCQNNHSLSTELDIHLLLEFLIE